MKNLVVVLATLFAVSIATFAFAEGENKEHPPAATSDTTVAPAEAPAKMEKAEKKMSKKMKKAKKVSKKKMEKEKKAE